MHLKKNRYCFIAELRRKISKRKTINILNCEPPPSKASAALITVYPPRKNSGIVSMSPYYFNTYLLVCPIVALKRAVWDKFCAVCSDVYSSTVFFFGRRGTRMFGKTPPWAIVIPFRSFFSSSSFRRASCRWRGLMRSFLLSREALPANSIILKMWWSFFN